MIFYDDKIGDIQAPAKKMHNVSAIHTMAAHEHFCGSIKRTIKMIVIEVLYFIMLVHAVTNHDVIWHYSDLLIQHHAPVRCHCASFHHPEIL